MPTEVMDKHRCQEIFAELLKYSDADETELLIGGGASALTRFANNTIHQNVAEEGFMLSVRTAFGQRTARATTNKFDSESLKRVVAESSSLARQQQPDPELMPMPGPQNCPPVNRFFESTDAVSPRERAEAVAAAIRVAEQTGLTAAGTFSTGSGMYAILNSRGLADHYRGTHAECSITTTGSTSTGWTKKTSPDVHEINAVGLAERASQIAVRSRDPQEVAPGNYVAILSPEAVLDLVGFMFADFSGQAVRDQRSFLTDRVGTKLFGESINISDDVYHPLQFGAPFDGEGICRKALPLVEHGVIKNLTYARSTAKAMGTEPTGHGFPLPNEYGESPANIVFAGGDKPVEEMIGSTERGILVTRLWYIREVDPYKKILTGMTRDGTFLIENGRIAHGVRNFRFNESLIDMLNRVEMLSTAERASGDESAPIVGPALKISSFHFSEVTKF